MADRTFLVLGATGSTGRRVTRSLRTAGHEVRAASRGASRSGEVRFDWGEPDSWEPAVAGAWGLYLMAPDGVPVDPAFVARAVDAGVRRIVLLSSTNIEAMGDERLMAAERTVRGSGAEWTIVRPDWFNQNFDEGIFRADVLAGEVTLPLGGQRFAFVDADDIAAVAATALTEEGHAGHSYTVMGPRPLSFTEALDTIGRESGRPVRFRGTVEEYVAARAAAGASTDGEMPDVAAFAALRELGDEQPNDVVERVAGREPKDFTTYVAEAVARGAWRG